MSPAADDPKDPGQKRAPARLRLSGLEVITRHIEPAIRLSQDEIARFHTTPGYELDKHMTAFMLYAFVAESGLRPSECSLIQMPTTDGGLEYFFMPRDAHERQRARVDELKDEIEALRQEIRELRARR